MNISLQIYIMVKINNFGLHKCTKLESNLRTIVGEAKTPNAGSLKSYKYCKYEIIFWIHKCIYGNNHKITKSKKNSL